jgi:hypothetical protein
MLGCYRLLSNDSTFNSINDKISESLYYRYKASSIRNLESYPSSIWIADNTVALASLKLNSINTNSHYASVCTDWVKYAREHYIDLKTGVLCSTIDPKTGKKLEEPRGSMLGWSIMFIFQFDENFAIEQYNNYRQFFSYDIIILRLFKERYTSWNTNIGDIDSGPIFLGFSIPANEFALGGSILAKDFGTTKKLERLIDIGTEIIIKHDELRYRTNFYDLNISPMAEAIVLYSLTITKWENK